MSSLRAPVPVEFVSTIAAEIAASVEAAVEFWLADVEAALLDERLTTLGRMNAVHKVLEHYKTLTGKAELRSRAGHSVVVVASREVL